MAKHRRALKRWSGVSSLITDEGGRYYFKRVAFRADAAFAKPEIYGVSCSPASASS